MNTVLYIDIIKMLLSLFCLYFVHIYVAMYLVIFSATFLIFLDKG